MFYDKVLAGQPWVCGLPWGFSWVSALEECIVAIGQWMSANRLKLDAEKTELMWAGTRYSVANLLCDHDLSLTLGADIVKATDVIRVLGAWCAFHTGSRARETSYIRQRQVFVSVASAATCEAFTRP